MPRLHEDEAILALGSCSADFGREELGAQGAELLEALPPEAVPVLQLFHLRPEAAGQGREDL